MLKEPRLKDYDQPINKAKTKIKQIKNKLTSETSNASKKDQRTPQQLDQLNIEYEDLSQLRVKQCNSLLDQWSTYQTEERRARKIDIDKRQAEFDKELDLQHKKRTEKQKKKSEVAKKLIHLLRKALEGSANDDDDEDEDEKIQILNSHSDVTTDDTSVVTMSADILELFWSIDVNVPVTQSEILLTITQLEKGSD